MERRLIGEVAEVRRAVDNHHNHSSVAAAKILDANERQADHAETQTRIMAETLAAVKSVTGVDWFKVARNFALLMGGMITLGVMLGRLGGDGLLKLFGILNGNP